MTILELKLKRRRFALEAHANLLWGWYRGEGEWFLFLGPFSIVWESRPSRIRARLVNQIESETEQRAVECTLERDYLAFKVRTIRNDTGAVVGERAMEEGERQRILPEAK